MVGKSDSEARVIYLLYYTVADPVDRISGEFGSKGGIKVFCGTYQTYLTHTFQILSAQSVVR